MSDEIDIGSKVVLKKNYSYSGIGENFLKSRKVHVVTSICVIADVYYSLEGCYGIFNSNLFELAENPKSKQEYKLEYLKDYKIWLESKIKYNACLESEIREEIKKVELAIINLEEK